MHSGCFLSKRAGAAVTTALILSVAGCGGGGGSAGSSNPAPLAVDLTTTNQDHVSRAAAAAAQGNFASGAVPLADGGSGPLAAGRSRALAAVVLRAMQDRKRITAVSAPNAEACAVSGSVTTTLDDRDNSGAASVGDALTVLFSNCKDVVDETINGTLTVTLSRLATSPRISFTATAGASAFSVTAQGRSEVYNGDFTLTFAQTSATVDTTHVVIGSQLAVQVSAPKFNDTITLLSGLTIDSTSDTAALPPGGTVPGLTTSTTSGEVASAAAGGKVTVSTVQPLLQYDVDVSPRSGQLNVVGKTGALKLTALPGGLVRIDLDANGDGIFEESKTVAWDLIF